MRHILIATTLTLLATPALASRTPINTAYQYQPVWYQPPSHEAASVYRRHRVRHAQRLRAHSSKHHPAERHVAHAADKPRSSRRPVGEAVKAIRKPVVSDPPTLPTLPDPLDILSRATVALFEGFADGMAMPRPRVVHSRPRQLTGTLTINGKRFAYASGGNGWSIPYGDHRITPEAVGHWGKKHGAIGLADDEIKDPQLGRTREGIEIHAAHHMASAGCVVVKEFDVLKHDILAMIDTAGSAFLHVGPDGAAITPTKESPLPPVIYLAERVADEESHRERHHERHVHHLPHWKHYAHHRIRHYARA